MIETEYALRQTFFTTIGSNLSGSVTLGPTQAFTRWKLTRYSVLATKNASGVNCTFTLYRGASASGQVIDFTQQGAGDSSDANDVELSPGEYVTGVWTQAQSGSQAQITIEGSIFVKGQRSY